MIPQIRSAVRSWTAPGSGPDTHKISPGEARGLSYSAGFRELPRDAPPIKTKTAS